MVNTKFPVKSFGELKKIKLISCPVGFGRRPAPDKEVEQRLFISMENGIWLSRYCEGPFMSDHRPLISRRKIKTDAETIRVIMTAIQQAMKNYQPTFVTDVGTWELTLENQEGDTFVVSGSAYTGALPQLCSFIRDKLGRPDLFLFDGAHYHEALNPKSSI